jgi:hypothetical protein
MEKEIKKDLTEEKLLKLGFKRTDVSAEESGDEAYCYFTLDLDEDGYDCLIAHDEDNNGFYIVELFNSSELGICYTEEETKTLYKALKREDLC